MKNGISMGIKVINSRGSRGIPGAIFILNVFSVGGLQAFTQAAEVMEYNTLAQDFLADYLLSTITLPWEVFSLLLLGNIVALLLIVRFIYKRFFGKAQVWSEYRLDTFFWAEWQWDYTWNGKITNLWCECDKCAERMKPKVVPDGTDGLGIRFICNHCGKQSTTIRSVENEAEALDRVEKKILRKIRVGKFRGEIEGHMLGEHVDK